MSAADLRTRARAAAEERYPYPDVDSLTYPLSAVRHYKRGAFVRGALWHAAQQPTREQIARAVADDLYARNSEALEKRPGETYREHAEHIGEWAADVLDDLLNGADR